jgi:hypothetical protein
VESGFHNFESVARMGIGCFVLAVTICGSTAWAQSSQSGSIVQEVSTEDVKKFIDPTLMISGFDYTFEARFLPGSSKVYANVLSSVWAIKSWTAVWADIPYKKRSLPDEHGPWGIGDVLLGWGAITHENLQGRFTTSVITFEALAPTGDPDKDMGSGAWVLAPGGAIALNPTDKFPIYIVGRYLHSLGSSAGDDRGEEVTERPDLRVRSLELTVQTVHILPKGFWVSAIPSFVFDFNQDHNFFALGVGVGRALNPSFAISGSYVHHLAGWEAFNQVLTFQVSFLAGKRKGEGRGGLSRKSRAG